MEKFTDSDLFDIRYTGVDDEPYLKEWMHAPDMIRWFPVSNLQEADMMIKNWIGFSKYKCSLTATYKDQPIGIGTLFLMPYRKVAHLSMVYIIVDPAFQRKGIGFSLLRNLKHLAKTYFKLYALHLEVYSGCPVMELLKKTGFKEVFRQEKFVKEDDGYLARIVMETKL